MIHCRRSGGDRARVRATRRHKAWAVAAVVSGCMLSACASGGASNPNDPFESFNRAMFGLNQAIDDVIVSPIITIHDAIVPEPIRQGIGNIFATAGTAGTFANNLLQGKPDKAGEDLARIFVNATLGLGGIFDIATEMGIPQNNEDFGQTLGVWGMEQGPYLVLPLVGPSSSRDMFHIPFAIFTNPTFYVGDTPARLGVGLGRAVTERSQAQPAIDRRDESALDPYIFTREAYLQRREFMVEDGERPEAQLDDADLDDILGLPDDMSLEDDDVPAAEPAEGADDAPERESRDDRADDAGA